MRRRDGWLWIAGVFLLGCGDDATATTDSGTVEERDYQPGGGRCGDGTLGDGEECDGTVLGQSCESLGKERGPLTCTERCTIDTSQCGTNPRPDPPMPSDGGFLFPDAGTAQGACEAIVECGAIPLPTVEDGVFELVQGLGHVQFCISRLEFDCQQCVVSEALTGFEALADMDGGDASCTSDCRDKCAGLSIEHTVGLFDADRCVSTANDFVHNFDGQCLCDECMPLFGNCMQDRNCYAALLCIDDTRCEGTACSERGVCLAPIRALSFSSSSQPLDDLRACITNAGCKKP